MLASDTIAETDHSVIEKCYHQGLAAVLKRARDPQNPRAAVRWRSEVEMLQSIGRHVSTLSFYLYWSYHDRNAPLESVLYNGCMTFCYKHKKSQNKKSWRDPGKSAGGLLRLMSWCRAASPCLHCLVELHTLSYTHERSIGTTAHSPDIYLTTTHLSAQYNPTSRL